MHHPSVPFRSARALFLSAIICLGAVGAEGGLDCTEVNASTPPNPAFAAVPFTVACRVRLPHRDTYQIVVANEWKNSATHWELFATPNEGMFTAYLPGRRPDHVSSRTVITDDAWHVLTMAVETQRVRLWVDGTLVADEALSGPDRAGTPGPFGIGQLAEGGFGCTGTIAAVHLARGVRPPSATTFATDDRTIAWWDFAQSGMQSPVPDKSGRGPVVTLRYVPGTTRFLPLPDPPAVAPMREQVAELTAHLNLSKVRPAAVRDAVWWSWQEEFTTWNRLDHPEARQVFHTSPTHDQEVLDRHALVWIEDGGPAGTVLRRTGALLEHLRRHGATGLDALAADLVAVRTSYEQVKQAADTSRQRAYFLTACAIRRQLAFRNPLLDFDGIMCAARGTFEGSVRSNPVTGDDQGGHFVTQYFGFNALAGGGLYTIRNWKDAPVVTDLLKNATVASGPMQGQMIAHGAVATPDLDFDGKRIVFAWSGNKDHQWTYSSQRLFHLFSINTDGSQLAQLSDGGVDDFDPCWLPDGRVAFISERRGGYIRCFGAGIKVRQYSLFAMAGDGRDITPLSYYETSEWNPSVNNDGMLVYTRWDYTDRENCLGTRFWVCGPDGSNPRAPHGNYPKPFHTFPDRTDQDSRYGTPLVEMGIRSIPDSHRYICTAAPHHGAVYGSLAMLDMRVPDDGRMSQVRRITPDEPFPESETHARRHYKYGTPWALSEDIYLCNRWENLIYLDRFGNQEMILDLRELPCRPDERLRIIDPMPLRPRIRPAVVPNRTAQGAGPAKPAGETAKKATISVINVYDSDLPFPKDARIRWLRVVQNILKCNHAIGEPMIGYERENTPRIPLGIVPVESDGSAYFEAPVAKELILQALDENHMAVQSMRSVAFVHPGEQLTCTGCHESTMKAPSPSRNPLAMQRPPSPLKNELGAIEPISYYRQIRPIVEKSCVPCHQEQKKGPQDMRYEALKEDSFWFSGGMAWNVASPYSGIHGGTRTIPGRFGARASRLGKALMDATHRTTVSDADRHAMIVWLDCNSLRLGAYHREAEQLQGTLVWPDLDVDSAHPQGTEGGPVRLRGGLWHQNRRPQSILCGTHRDQRVDIIDGTGAVKWFFKGANPQDVWMLPDGHVLVAWQFAVQEIIPDLAAGSGGTVVWEYRIEAPNEIPTCQPLPDGRVLIGIVGQCRLVEVDRQGKVVHTVQLSTTVKEPHAQFRLCRKTAAGTYLVPFTAEGAVREYAADGSVIRTFPRLPSPVGVVRLPDGNTLISAGGRVTEYDAKDRVVWELVPNDIPDIDIGILAGIQRMPDGSTVVCNWGSSAKEGKTATHIFCVGHDQRLLWQISGDSVAKVAQCRLLDGEAPLAR